MVMTNKQLKALRLRKRYERDRNVSRRNTPRHMREQRHVFFIGNKRPYRLHNI